MSVTAFHAMTPITRFSATVHDRDDEHIIGLDGVQHRVLKDMDKASPHIFLKDTPAHRSLGNLTERGLNTRDESKLKTWG